MKHRTRMLWSLFCAVLPTILNARATETNSQGAAAEIRKQAAPLVQVVNASCPVSGAPLDPNGVAASRTREYKGQTIGFCCDFCPKKWDRMTEEEKSKNLAEAMESTKP